MAIFSETNWAFYTAFPSGHAVATLGAEKGENEDKKTACSKKILIFALNTFYIVIT